MGGSGKTTLIAKTYNCKIVKRHFKCSAWITVSQTYLMLTCPFRHFVLPFLVVANLVPSRASVVSFIANSSVQL
ncbi:hypothetical protein Tsubulata_007242 [Turnera subulata]|uniref:NB-ARC domain-containing protein n=1 Tax=Turnera subulata TaxID=218843 RepID=A0A9Q0FK08_9ROSI|nr:hypothetical protein Tsubulata_007242 [Turnera subulata]